MTSKSNFYAQFGLGCKNRIGGVVRKPILAENKKMKSGDTYR